MNFSCKQSVFYATQKPVLITKNYRLLQNRRENMDEKLRLALQKRAEGYIQKEITEEYCMEDNVCKLIKRKVITKDIPPDIDALKLLLNGDDLSQLSDAQLEEEIEKLKAELLISLQNQEKNSSDDKKMMD